MLGERGDTELWYLETSVVLKESLCRAQHVTAAKVNIQWRRAIRTPKASLLYVRETF